MSESSTPWLRRRAERPRSLRWATGDALAAGQGDTVSLTLFDHGILETSRSVKYRRPRGPYCLGGDCGTCLVRIDGRPNQRACLTPVADGMVVQAQNLVVQVGPDPTRLVDKVMRGGMDHHHFMVRPRLVNQAMQAVARELTGLGTLPDRVPEGESRHVQHAPDVLVVGAGKAGTAAVEVLARAGLRVLWADRAPAGDTPPPVPRLDRTGVFGAYPAEGLWAAMTDDGTGPPTLHTVRPRHVLLCVGARDPILPLPNNDLPGVVAARGLVRQLRRAAAVPDVPVVVVGDGPFAARHAQALRARVVAPAQVQKLDGGRAVEEVVLSGERLEARLVALAPTPSPAHDLARQAGARLRFDGAGFATLRDERGHVTRHGETDVWAAGDVCGYMGDAAADDGRRVAAIIATTRGGR